MYALEPEPGAADLPAPELAGAADLPAPELPVPEPAGAADLPAPELPVPELPAPEVPAPERVAGLARMPITPDSPARFRRKSSQICTGICTCSAGHRNHEDTCPWGLCGLSAPGCVGEGTLQPMVIKCKKDLF